ncbi:MAG TPA: hypothetical protein VL727_15765 [Puia sp.]|jgi:hypothetical protein|nr:hypothetical protein [Puia sp.]
MKKHHTYLCFMFALIAMATIAPACKKEHQTAVQTKIQYQLYTAKDFSNVHDTIAFRLVIRAGNTTLFDSALAPMRISEIPDKTHQLAFGKLVPPGHEQTDLVVGFLYSIKNIGMSWYLDSCKAGQALKIVDYNFQ